MTGRTPWSVLGVAEDASYQDVRRAFRRRVKESHPDRGGDRRDFVAVVRSYEDLRTRRPAARPPSASPAPDRPRPPSPTPYDPWVRPVESARTWGERPAPGAASRVPTADFGAVLRAEMARMGGPASS